jgi:subtilisin-like proprotein convertase family protein
MKNMTIRLSLLGWCLLALLPAFSQQSFWADTELKNAEQSLAQQRLYKVDKFRAVSLDVNSLRAVLGSVPMEQEAGTQPTIIEIPMPNGEMMPFEVVETRVMAPGLAERYPAIRTYRGWNPDNTREKIRFGYSPKGFYATILSEEGAVYIDRLTEGAAPLYMSYFVKENPNHELRQGFTCDADHEGVLPPSVYDAPLLESRSASDPVTLRTYRFAVATTAQYTSYHGGTVADGLAAVVQTVNRLNQVLERDAAIRLELIENNDQLIFLDNATDGLSNGQTGDLLSEITAVINSTVGIDSYDIGHVLNVHGDAVGNGVAILGGACTLNKARGVSGITEPEGDPFIIDIVAHEVGHQFAASHTMSSCQNVSDATAFEPGSGSTIMSYAGICSPSDNVQNFTYAHYHTASLEQMRLFVNEQGGSGCGTATPTGNTNPVVDIPLPNNFFVPISTPFELTGAATDAEGDELTYCWEQYDLGPNNTGLGNPSGNSPLFRVFPPTASPTRVIPRMELIIANETDPAELLPTYGRDLSFRCTVRDNNPDGGGVAWDLLRFKSDETAGPFLVQSPNEGDEVWTVGEYREVTWDVANTTNNRVNCQLVNIRLSTDGGMTYPITLAENEANDGSAFVNVPDEVTGDARIRVEAADNIFFDISNEDFEIAAPTVPGYGLALSETNIPLYCIPGDPITIDISTTSFLDFDSTLTFDLLGDLPMGTSVEFTQTSIQPGESTSLTLDIPVQPIVRDTLNLQVRAIAMDADTSLRDLRIVLRYNDFSALAPLAPEDGTADIVISTPFSWVDVLSANSYEFELATSPAFGDSIIYTEAGIVETVDFVPDGLELERNNFYYWRVRPVTECGTGPWTNVSVFRTASTDCVVYQPTDLPINVPGVPNVKESRILISDAGTISDINIADIDISFTPINALRLTLVSPLETEAVLFDQDCLNTGLLRVGFDDEAPSGVNCPPISFALAQPEEPLSIFDGENTAGEWNLKLEVVGEGSGVGNFRDWNIEFCATTIPAKPSLLVNETLFVPPGESNTITTEQLAASDDNYGPSEVKFRIIEGPQHGTLLRGGEALAENDHFLQVTIDGFNLAYQHDGGEALTDEFRFIVENPEEGFIPVQTFRIEIDENAIVNTQVVETAQSFTLFPNPTTDEVLLQMDRPADTQAQVMLTNLQGQLLQRHIFPQGERLMQLTTNNLPEGVYLVILQTENGRKAEKLIIQR